MPSNVSLDDQLLAILSDEGRRSAIPSSFRDSTSIGSDTHSDPELLQGQRWNMCLDALKWVCLIFPRTKSQDVQCRSMVLSLVPLIRYLLDIIQPADTPKSLKNDVVEVLLAATKIDRDMLPIASKYIEPNTPPELRAHIALEQSISFRLDWKHNDSEWAIHNTFPCCNDDHGDHCFPDFFQTYHPANGGLSNALVGLLHLSHLENLVQRGMGTLAHVQMYDWTTLEPHPVSTMELSTLSPRILTLSKIHRAHGDLQIAQVYLETCIKGKRDPYHHELLCQLVDVYIDLGWTKKARILVDSEAKQPSDGVFQDSQAARHFAVSSLDFLVQAGDFQKAKKLANTNASRFQSLSNLNASDELLYLRVLIATAQIGHLTTNSNFADAAQKWEHALDHAKKCKNSEGLGYAAIAYISLSLTSFKIGQNDYAAQCLHRGVRILRERKQCLWIPPYPRWLDLVKRKLRLEEAVRTRWPLGSVAQCVEEEQGAYGYTLRACDGMAGGD
jgi:tetratricopeptide (TPR) repeat protein